MERDFIEMALECVQKQNYGSAAHQLSKTDETELQAECERLHELLGNHTEMLGGTLGQVISNYGDRLIEELAEKAAEGENQ